MRQPWHWQALQLGSTYLPVIVMAMLAIGTWWLVKNAHQPGDDRPPRVARHEPDYEMHGFSVQRYNPDGSLKAQLQGQALRHYPDTDSLEIDDVRLRAINQAGQLTVATARQATSNDAGTQVELKGGAQIVQEASAKAPAIEFRSEQLAADLDQDLIHSNKPVSVRQGSSEVRSEAMSYRRTEGIVQFSGRTRASFDPVRKP